MSNTTFHQVSSSQADNRASLAHGVKGVKCIAAGSRAEVRSSLSSDHLLALAKMDSVIGKLINVTMGTIEVYANGALNVYLKENDNVVGYVTYRP